MRRQLRRVDQHPHTACVGGGADLFHRRQPSRHVGGAGHREQRRPRAVVEHPHDVVDAERAFGTALDPPARRRTGPGQQVGVVLDDGRDDDVGGTEAEPVGQVVDRLGRVADEHDHVASAGGPPGEAVGTLAGLLVGGGGAP